jgi:hypothetical protein
LEVGKFSWKSESCNFLAENAGLDRYIHLKFKCNFNFQAKSEKKVNLLLFYRKLIMFEVGV